MSPSKDERSLSQSVDPKPGEQGLASLAIPSQELKTYHGRRNADGSSAVWVVDDPTIIVTQNGLNDAAARDLPFRLDLRNHSPTGFSWGYEGSGPAQLSLAVLADALRDDELAQTHYQNFKRNVISRLGDSWMLTAVEIRQFVDRQQVDSPTPESGA
jgi:hypothetical protein